MKTTKHITIKLPDSHAQFISEAKEVFSGWIDSDFKEYGLNKATGSSHAMLMDIYDLTENGTFKDIFESFNIPLDSLVVSQGQVIEFAKTLEKDDKHDYFFLLKQDGEFFVANVYFGGGGRLMVGVYRFSLGDVWDAGCRRRVVVPQLTPKPLESSPSDTLTLESAIEICKKAGLLVYQQK